MVISNRVSKVVILSFIFFSKCKIDHQEDLNSLIYNASVNQIGISKYNEIQNRLRDTLITWTLNNLKDSKEIINYPYIVDSLICFNREKDKFIGSILVQCNTKDCQQEDIILIYGVNINNNWFFFFGPTFILPRENYNSNTHTSLSFDKMHSIALKEIYSNYLDKNGEIRNAFFNDLTSNAWCTNCKTKTEWNLAYMQWVKNNWASRDTTQPIIQLPSKTNNLP